MKTRLVESSRHDPCSRAWSSRRPSSGDVGRCRGPVGTTSRSPSCSTTSPIPSPPPAQGERRETRGRGARVHARYRRSLAGHGRGPDRAPQEHGRPGGERHHPAAGGFRGPRAGHRRGRRRGIPVVTTELDAPGLPACVLLLRWGEHRRPGPLLRRRVFQHFADAGATGPIDFVVTSCLPTVTGQQDRLNGFTERVAELNADSPFQLFQVGFYNTTTDPAKNLANIQNIYTADGENIQLAYAMCGPDTRTGGRCSSRTTTTTSSWRATTGCQRARPHRGRLDRLGTGEQPLPGRQPHRQGAVRPPRQRHAAAEGAQNGEAVWADASISRRFATAPT